MERKSLKAEWDETGELPYVLDLLYDVKHWDDVVAVMSNLPTRCSCTPEELEEMVIEYGYYL